MKFLTSLQLVHLFEIKKLKLVGERRNATAPLPSHSAIREGLLPAPHTRLDLTAYTALDPLSCF